MKTKAFGLSAILLIASIIFVGIQAEARQTTKLRFASVTAVGTATELSCDRLKECIEARSKGKIEVVRYPAGELYSTNDLPDALAAGAIEMGNLHFAPLGGMSYVFEFICGVGGSMGCWASQDSYVRFLENPAVREIIEREMETRVNSKFMNITYYPAGMGCTMFSKPVHTVADLKGLRIRCAGASDSKAFSKLGASPVHMSAGEVYMALQRGTLQGGVSGPGRFVASKWYEVCKYVTVDGTRPYSIFFQAINLGVWNGLSKENQRMLMECAKDMEKWSRDASNAEDQKAYEQLKQLGVEVYKLPKSERAKMRAVFVPLMRDSLIKRVGKDTADKLWGLLEATNK
jgi:TRAP-type C4-dicarboxylate transport system substrate-binding protein